MKLLIKSITFIIMLAITACIEDFTTNNVEFEYSNPKRSVDVAHTPTERQSIGNCWLYAQATWVESMHKRATGENIDISQSYWTYMHWYMQIKSKNIDEISTGGTWDDANKIIRKFGLMKEVDFISEDNLQEKSLRQKTALTIINESLKNGSLSKPGNRSNSKLVREALDEAWELSEDKKAMLDQVFGEDMSKTFYNLADETGTPIIQAKDLKVEYTYGPNSTYTSSNQTLETAMWEWRKLTYRYSSDRKKAMRKVLRALSSQEPVLISWFVDFNALEKENNEREGSFNRTTLDKAGEPGRQGAHLTALEDYEAKVTLQNNSRIEQEGQINKNEWKVYGPFNFTDKVKVKMTGTGDADIYVLNGSRPTKNNYDARPYKYGSKEECSVIGFGNVYVAVNGFDYHSKYKLEITGKYFDSSDDKVDQITLKAGVTLDRRIPKDALKLDAALEDDSEIVFLRIKNSWGGPLRTDMAYAPHTEKGYHDLYMDYLTKPVKICSKKDEETGEKDCSKTIIPLKDFIIPPGY